MISELKGATVNAKVWAPIHEVESQALSQLRNIASLPWVRHVAVMPDVHYGMGATVGSVIAMQGAVSPAAVGVDNRSHMLFLYKQALQRFFPDMVCEEAILCHHNYVSEECHHGEDLFVTRKGAIRAGRGELGIIPGSMGTRSYIVRGKGCAESLESASHGAGRRMSRGQAKRSFTVGDIAVQTHGVECRKDAGVLDEIPQAYKDIDQVMANQADLVEVVATLKQVMCVKG